MKQLVTYLRSNREPRELSARLDAKAIAALDPMMERLGYERVGKQDELFVLGLARCSDCRQLFDPKLGGAVLPDEAHCRSCIKRKWGGER